MNALVSGVHAAMECIVYARVSGVLMTATSSATLSNMMYYRHNEYVK